MVETKEKTNIFSFTFGLRKAVPENQIDPLWPLLPRLEQNINLNP